MKPLGLHNYFIYILTNKSKEVLYIGVTNDVKRRIYEHQLDANNKKETFAGKYNCIYLIYWERFEYVNMAIAREKQLKGWNRSKKETLINEFNPEWKFLNNEL
jgi:putative endonuclease